MGISVLHSQGRSKVPSNPQQVVSLSGTRSWKLSLYTLQAIVSPTRRYFHGEKKPREIISPLFQFPFLSLCFHFSTASSSIASALNLHYRRHRIISPPNICRKIQTLRCGSTNDSSAKNEESEPENLLLKIAWYGSEFLGVAASLLRYPAKSTEEVVGSGVELAVDGFGKIDRAVMVETIKDDFRRSYFVRGNLTTDAHEEDCQFADLSVV